MVDKKIRPYTTLNVEQVLKVHAMLGSKRRLRLARKAPKGQEATSE